MKRPWLAPVAFTMAALLWMSCAGVGALPDGFTGAVLFGWVEFLVAGIARAPLGPHVIPIAMAAAVAVVVTSHFLLAWLRPGGRWRWRWTLCGYALLGLLAASALAATALVRRAFWIAESPNPIVEHASCARRMSQISMSLLLYAHDHGGRYPNDFSALIVAAELSPNALVCPSSGDLVELYKTPAEHAAHLHEGHCSYIFLAPGAVMGSLTSDVPIVIEQPDNHGQAGMHVLYGDGRVDWVSWPEAQRIFRDHGLAP